MTVSLSNQKLPCHGWPNRTVRAAKTRSAAAIAAETVLTPCFHIRLLHRGLVGFDLNAPPNGQGVVGNKVLRKLYRDTRFGGCSRSLKYMAAVGGVLVFYAGIGVRSDIGWEIFTLQREVGHDLDAYKDSVCG